MDIDRFWQLIDQARAAAGPLADQAVRDGYPLDGDDEEQFEALVEAVRAELAEAELADEELAEDELAEGESEDDEDEGENDDEDDDEDEDEEDNLVDPVAVALRDLLAQLPAAEIADFDNTFEDLRAQADTAEMVAAATLIEHGLLGDDSFEDFLAGLVALGRATFEAAVANPDSLADHPVVREIATARDYRWLGREDVLFAASYAYAKVTGEDVLTFVDYAAELREAPPPPGVAPEEQWDIVDEAQTRARLPRLSELFYEHSARNRRRVLGD